MTGVFTNVRWLPWLALMMAYSGFYFLVDTLVVSRALTWFIEPIRVSRHPGRSARAPTSFPSSTSRSAKGPWPTT